MPNASIVNINEQDNTTQVITPIGGIQAINGISLRGPFGAKLHTSLTNFLREMGGYLSTTDDIQLVERIFKRGGQVIFNKLGHYTTISDASSLTAVKAAMRYASKTWYIRLNGPLVADNIISLNVGAVIPTTFATSNDATLAAFVTALEGNANVAAASIVSSVSGSTSNDRTIILVMANSTVPSTLAITGTSAPTGTLDIANFFLGGINEKLFQLTPKNPGADYNNLVYDILAASNGSVNYFNLKISHLTDATLTSELYENLFIDGNPTIPNSVYLQKVIDTSKIVDVTYFDLSATTGQLRPINNSYINESGSDGGTIDETDVAGNSAAKTGIYALDAFEDMTFIATPSFATNTMFVIGSAYTANRKDCIYVCNLSKDNVTAQDFVDDRDATGIDSKYACAIGGGTDFLDPLSRARKDFSEVGDFLAAHSENDAKGKPWISVAGTEQGQLPGVLGIVRDFGPSGSYNDLNLLANHQIMMVGTRDKVKCILGNYTLQLANSKFSFLSIVKLIIFIKKGLKPTLNRYLEKPNLPSTWKNLYNEVTPFLDDLASADNEALIGYSWQGDQFASPDLSNLSINDPDDVDAGKYKVKLKLKTASPIIEITLDIIMTRTSVSFEDSL